MFFVVPRKNTIPQTLPRPPNQQPEAYISRFKKYFNKEMLIMKIGDNIATLRAENGLTQDGLAQSVFAARSTVSNWESGVRAPSFTYLESLSEYFGVSIHELVKVDIGDIKNMIAERQQDVFQKCYYNGAGYNSYLKAFEMEAQDVTGKNVLDICKLYSEAFESGILEAGANMLEYLMRIHMDLADKNVNREERFPFAPWIDAIVEKLIDEDHPAGEYYLAVARIYNILDVGDEEDIFDTGMLEMFQLASEGNQYARNFVELCKRMADEFQCD